MTEVRDPYPFPKLEGDDKFGPKTPSPPKEVVTLRRGELDPWNRLNLTPTLSSFRRDAYYYDPKAPNDKLDFVMKTRYDHHNEFMKSTAESLVQPETLGLPHGRILKNRPVEVKPVTLKDKPLVEYTDKHKKTISSEKGLAIEGHHSEATNRGYSRKHDGGFYAC